jgi:aminopeptidase N
MLSALPALLLIAGSQDSLAAPGVSRALAEHRARTIAEVEYDLVLDVSALDSAVGQVGIRFRRSGEGDVILDFRGRRLLRITANGAPLALDAWNGAHVRIGAAALRPGPNTVAVAFVAEIAPSGASIIRVHDPDGSDYLYTLLVPADANQLFPCFDQPDLKARVSLTLTTPSGWTAVANGPLERTLTAGARTTHRFAAMPPISTYLVAFAAGPWHRATLTADGRTLHAYVRRSRAAEADLDTVLALNARALAWMEGYFDRPYPFPKFDLVLAPAFPFGGMEHPGAVFYNEDRFIFRERPTVPRRLGRFSTILHEVAHMWFGDLVTMRWFDDLWLKEGFATYMAAQALQDLDPESGAWKTFYLANKPAAYGVDQTLGTTPLWQALANLDQAKSAYGAIVYNKAPSVLKQLQYVVGDSAFRAGVQGFLTAHAFGNATWQDLLAAVGRAAGRPLDDFSRHWMLRPGMPEVEQRLTVDGGRIRRLELVQRPARPLSGSDPWPMRTQVLLWYPDRPAVVLPVELRGRVAEVRSARGLPAPAFVYPNAGDYGYLLALLDTASVRALEEGALARVADPLLRAMLWNSLWDQVRALRLAPERFVALTLRQLPAERDQQILPGVLARLGRAAGAYVDSVTRAALRPGIERVLWAGASDTALAYGLRRAYLDAFIASASTADGVARLTALFAADSAAGEPLRDPTRWDIVTRLRVLAAPDAESLAAAQAARDTTPDGRRRQYIAGAARRDPAVKAALFTAWFTDRSLNEDWASGSLGAFNAIEHQGLTLPFLRPALDSLPFIRAHRRIFFLGAWLGAFLGGQTSEAALAAVRQYLADHPDLPLDLRQKVLQYADELERTVRIRARAVPAPGR